MKSLGAGAIALAIASGAIVFGGPATPVQARERGASAYDSGAVADFYRARGGRPLWLSPSAGSASRDLLQLLATAQADNLNPNRYRVGNLSKALNAASTGNPAAVQRAEVMLSQAFVAYVRDTHRDPNVGIIYVDSELKPQPPSPRSVLEAAATAPSLADYVEQMRWMNPIYAQLRQAIASRMYLSQQQRQRAGSQSRAQRGRCPRAATAMSSSIRPRSAFTCTRTGKWSTRCGSSPDAPTRSPRRR